MPERGWGPVPLVALWLAAAPAHAADAPDLAACAECLRSSDLEAYGCLWILSRQGHADAVARRLGQALATDGSDDAARYVLARIESDQGRDGAEALYREAAAGFSRRGDVRGEVLARLGLAAFLVRRGRFADAETRVAEAEAVARAGGSSELLARVRSQRGWLAHQEGDFAGAWRLFKEVEAEVVPDGPLDLQALCLSGLGAVAQETGQLDASMEFIRRQAEVSHRLGDFYDEARARGNLVITAFRLASAGEMEPREIEPLAREALDAAVASANPGSVARAHLYLADLTSGLEAREHYRQGLEGARGVASLTSIVLALRGLALNLVEAEPRDPREAYRLVEEAIEVARGSPYYTALAHAARARMRWATGPRDQAVRDSLAALDAAEAIRDRQDDDLARARVFASWTFPYYRLAGHLLETRGGPGDLERAFAVGERMRARVLLDELDAAHATGALAPAGPARQRRSAVLAAIATVQRGLLDPTLPATARQARLAELERLELEEAAQRAEMARADPAFGALRASDAPPLTELQALLGADEALLSFLVAPRRNPDHRTTENGSWLWAVTRDSVRAYEIPDREELRSAVALYFGLLLRRDGSEAASAAHLYQRLVARALSDLPPSIGRLVVVGDGPLHRLPLGTLRPSPGAEPLAARYQMAVVPSATLWSRWRRTPARRGSGALVFADPPSAPGPREALGLGPLPHARREARAVVRSLGRGVFVRTGRVAAESALKTADWTDVGLLHLATHAVLDEGHPERSAILLAQDDASEDGLLQIREIVGLRLRDPVVFLSACRSAGGAVVDGEGPLGLARAFFQAGARAVVGSLWPVRDDEMEDLVGRFYRHAAAGRSVSEALAAAQRERIREGAPAAAWAGVVALGDGDAKLVAGPGGDAASATGGRAAPWLVLAVVLLAALVLARSRRP